MSGDSRLSRRTVLGAAGIGGIAGIAGIGYVGARSLARKGVINGRIIVGHEIDNGTIVGHTDIFAEYLDPDGPPDRRFNAEYRRYLPDDPPITVSQSAHRELQQAFDQIDYALSHNCPNADCSTPQVSRHGFNQVRLGDEVRLLYHSGDSATLLP